MDSMPTTTVECECETVGKPVDYLGDSVCKSPSANVRDIIKKYEPDRELINQTGSVGSVPYQRSLSRSLNRVLMEETEARPMQALAQQNSSKQVLTKSVEKTKGVGSKKSIGSLSKKPNSGNASKRSHSDMRQSLPSSESTYKSKTTITKTAHGVRITTDILFNSDTNIPEQWVGRRIDTDLPDSKILLDFESKNNMSK